MNAGPLKSHTLAILDLINSFSPEERSKFHAKAQAAAAARKEAARAYVRETVVSRGSSAGSSSK